METTINTESRAVRAIIGIAHAAGIAEMYLNTLDRIFNTVLYNQDDLGMSDTEAISTLQTLGLLRSDIQDIAADKDLASALGVGQQTANKAAAVSVERLRAFLYVANQKAIGLMEMVNDIVDDMQRMERNKAEIAEIREAADLALHAAKITKQALEREDARATGTQEGADE